MTRRLTLEEIRRRVAERHPYVRVEGVYVNQKSRLDCYCGKCGHAWNVQAASLSCGHGCPKCAGVLKKTDEQFRSELLTVNPTIEVLGKYVNDKTPLDFRCQECGWVWAVSPSSILQGSGCPKCAGLARKTTEQFKAELAKVNPAIEIKGEYINVHTKIELKCRMCGCEWSAEPNSVLNQGCGCPDCGRERTVNARRKTHEEFVEQVRRANPDIEVVGEYSSIHEKVDFLCKRCGAEWKAEPNSVLRGTGCPACFHGATSFAEQYIRFALEKALGADSVVSRDRVTIGSELDIYVPGSGFAVEYGAWYWHEAKVADDQKKLAACADAGIQLMIVYDGYPAGPPPFEGCRVYPGHLGEKRNRRELRALATEIASKCGGVADFSRGEWSAIASHAVLASRSTTTEGFREEIREILPDIEVVGEYRGDKEKVGVRCKKCGYEWQATAASFRAGHGCPSCAGNLRLTQEEFVARVANTGSNVTVIGDYVNSKTHVLVECNECARRWDAPPSTLLAGSGCKVCASKRAGARKMLTQEQFTAKVAAANPTVEVVGQYCGNKKKVLTRCTLHDVTWDALPSSLLRGNGCPKCKVEKIKRAQRKSHEAFVAEVAERNPSIIIRGQYLGDKERVECECSVCGNRWMANAGPLTRGTGCPECGKKKSIESGRHTHGWFLEEMGRLHPTIEVLGRYVNGKTKVECRCRVCGNEWSPTAASLVYGKTGCPACARARRRKR